MALLMQDFGTFYGLHIWVELEDDSLRVNEQSRLFLYAKNENKKVVANNIEIELAVGKIEIKQPKKPEMPTIMPNSITIENVVPGRTIRENLLLNVGNSKTGNYELQLSVDFQLVPATWELGPLPFLVWD